MHGRSKPLVGPHPSYQWHQPGNVLGRSVTWLLVQALLFWCKWGDLSGENLAQHAALHVINHSTMPLLRCLRPCTHRRWMCHSFHLLDRLLQLIQLLSTTTLL